MAKGHAGKLNIVMDEGGQGHRYRPDGQKQERQMGMRGDGRYIFRKQKTNDEQY
jgi:hypothetical protein